MDEIYEKAEENEYKAEAVTLRDILVNAIKMQALYANGKIRYTESSNVSN